MYLSPRLVILTLLTLVGALSAPIQGAAQTATGTSPPAAGETLAAMLEKEWSAQKDRMVALAEAMPSEKYEFKATAPQRTFGQQLLHLAEAHVRMLQRLDTARVVPAPTLVKDEKRPNVVKAVADAYDYGAALLSRAPDPLPPSHAQAFWRAMNNGMNHYGQCVVYLRLNDIVPPASR